MSPSLALIEPVQWIVDLLEPVLVGIHDLLGVGWGMSIVLLTVLVRAVMAPLTVKQFKSMRAMAVVAPQLKKIQEKYKDDKQRQQQEVMKFYSENKINPFASCLPLLAQFPFFIGLFYLLQTDLRLEICGEAGRFVDAQGKPLACGAIPNPTGAEQFLFVPDLTAGATGWVLVVLMLLYVGSQLLSTLLTPMSPDRTQRMLMLGLPLVFSIFILVYGFPSGLLVYWITTNLWTVGQGYLIRRQLGPIMPPQADGKQPAAPLKSPLMLALERVRGTSAPAPEPAAVSTVKSAGPSGPPPRPPRKKKKRSGRRR